MVLSVTVNGSSGPCRLSSRAVGEAEQVVDEGLGRGTGHDALGEVASVRRIAAEPREEVGEELDRLERRSAGEGVVDPVVSCSAGSHRDRVGCRTEPDGAEESGDRHGGELSAPPAPSRHRDDGNADRGGDAREVGGDRDHQLATVLGAGE